MLLKISYNMKLALTTCVSVTPQITFTYAHADNNLITTDNVIMCIVSGMGLLLLLYTTNSPL